MSKSKKIKMDKSDVMLAVSHLSVFIGRPMVTWSDDCIAWGKDGPEYCIWLWPNESKISVAVSELSENEFYMVAGYAITHRLGFEDLL